MTEVQYISTENHLPMGIWPIGPMCPGMGGKKPIPGGIPCIILGIGGIPGIGIMFGIPGLFLLALSAFEEDSPSLSTDSAKGEKNVFRRYTGFKKHKKMKMHC